MTGSAAGDTRYIDPDMPAAWDRMRDIAAEHGLDGPRHVLTPDEKRKRAELERRWWNEDRPDLAKIVDITVPTPSPDAPGNSVPVRLLYPNHQDPIPTIVYLHGGGWVVGSLETHARAMHYLALRTGACVAAVDYALAPEAKFPGALEQVVAVTRYLRDEADRFHLCDKRVAVAGDSAGGNLAIAAGLVLRNSDPNLVKALSLIYPVAGTDFATASYRELGDYGLTPDDMKGYFDHYLRDEADWDDPLAVPMKADLAGLPDTYVYAAGLDVLRDDSVMLDQRLRAAAVPGHLKIFEGVPHAFLSLTRTVRLAHALVAACASDLTDSFARSVP